MEGMVNVPLSDVLAVRAAGIYKSRDGYIGNVAGGDALNGVAAAAGRGVCQLPPKRQVQ